jgi:hypothetical protein
MRDRIFHLRELAHSRSGDKGDTSNVAVIAYRPEFFATILGQLSVERIRDHFGDLVRGRITRYELPQFHAINIVMEQALGGGVTRSLSLDPHGKSYSALILAMAVVVDEPVARSLRAAGRRPIDGDLLRRLAASGRLSPQVRMALE